MPSRYGAERDQVAETQPYEVRRGPWAVHLRVTGTACAEGAVHRWRAANGKRLKPRRLGLCRYVIGFAREGARTIRLRAKVGGKRLSGSRRIVVEDWLIVSIGDSVASGEGAPDVPDASQARWQSVRCHRSARAGPAVAARHIEEDDKHSSVTFVHLACSGATVPAGLLGPYAGVEPPVDEAPLEPQVDVLERIAAVRPIDAVLVSIGANDAHFGDIVRFCAQPAQDCFELPLPRQFGGDGERTVSETVRESLPGIARNYGKLAERISPAVPASNVYIAEYFDPTRDERGVTCERILGSVLAHELEHAQSQVLVPLNAAIARAAGANGWNLVEGVAQIFRNHGYCAGEDAWVTTLSRSAAEQGGTLRGRFLGTLHPNQAGHEATATLIAAALERDLYPNRTFPPRPLPPPADDSDGSGTVVVAFVAGMTAPLLLGAATVLVMLAVLGWAAILALLWLGREIGSLLLLGAVAGAGALLILEPEKNATLKRAVIEKATIAVQPLATLAKTARPLLLPLLVAVAVGAIGLSPVVQFLLAAALLVVAWKLIIAPEAEKSDVKLAWHFSLLRRIAVPSAIAIGLGVVAVVAVRLADLNSPYFESIDDLASGLVLFAVALWVAALILRLFSFATTPLRAIIAALIGLALLVLASGVGVLPWRETVGDAWPSLAGVLGALALLLLAIDVILGVIDGEERKPPRKDRSQILAKAAGLGLSAAAVAAVVLAAAIAVGLIDAAERGGTLNPPEEESATPRTLPVPGTAAEADLELARRYAPVLVFTKGERWAPVRVDSYVADATLSGPPGTPKKRTLATLPDRCPEFGQARCYALSIDCERGDLDCAQGRTRTPGRLYRDGAVYVRVLEKSAIPPEEPPGVFADRGPYRNQLETLIQYWYFYRYNEWRAPVFAGLLVQRHESDWEAVTIGLDGEGRPLFVANSAHCAGSWHPWREVEASTRLPGPRTHPLVAVAEGSHANYPDPEEERSPDWASCAGAPAGATTALSFASNIRDKTEFGWLWYPPADGWLRATPKEAPMSFPGAWGADDRLLLRNFASNQLSEDHAPYTPTLQTLWQDPVGLIFCGKYTPERCERDDRSTSAG
jgi:lysophospholipase L1-like esterase